MTHLPESHCLPVARFLPFRWFTGWRKERTWGGSCCGCGHLLRRSSVCPATKIIDHIYGHFSLLCLHVGTLPFGHSGLIHWFPIRMREYNYFSLVFALLPPVPRAKCLSNCFTPCFCGIRTSFRKQFHAHFEGVLTGPIVLMLARWPECENWAQKGVNWGGPKIYDGTINYSVLFYINIYMSRTFATTHNPAPGPRSPDSLTPFSSLGTELLWNRLTKTREETLLSQAVVLKCQPPGGKCQYKGVQFPQFRQLFYYDSPL